MNKTKTNTNSLTNLKFHHYHEWLASGVDSELIEKNVISIEGTQIYDYLFYSDKQKRLNNGRLPSKTLKRCAPLEHGGWWVRGIDVITNEDSLWGQFKPDSPRISYEKNKPIKYEAPHQVPTELIALKPSKSICTSICSRYDLLFHDNPDNFWGWLKAVPEIPLVITEGAKKAASLMSKGFAAIALPGVHNGYRVPKDKHGNKIAPPHLISQLKAFAQPGRKIYFAFDNDQKESTRINVAKAIRTTAELFRKEGCKPHIISWTGSDKGVDDLIVNQGAEAFEIAYDHAQPLISWEIEQVVKLSYAPDEEVDSRYLPEITPPPEANVIAIKAPKGTGKTEWIAKMIKEYLHTGERRIIVLSHRVQLCQNLCQRFGIDYHTQRFVSDTKGVFGIGLCVDSLHGKSAAKFNPEDWHGAIIIFDEVEQVMWHTLNSSTCKSDRVPILKNLKQLVQNALNYGGKIFLADADLGDIALDWIWGLAGKCHIEQWLLVNNFKPHDPWDVYNYDHKTPDGLVKNLVDHIKDGGRPFVCLSGQKAKSTYGTQGLEKKLREYFPDLMILRIDSETISDPQSDAYGCITGLNEILPRYHIVIVSPAIETGVSIECCLSDGITPHFTSVWCIAQGIQTSNSVCQALARVRAPLPRHIWVNKLGFQKIANGATTVEQIVKNTRKKHRAHINMLLRGGFALDESAVADFQSESLNAWSKRGVVINLERLSYRETVLNSLKEEGHNVMDWEEPIEGTKEMKEELMECRDELYEQECDEIVAVGNPDNTEYEKLKDKRSKTRKERLRYKHGYLARTYKIPVSKKLIKLNDNKWLKNIRLHYDLTKGRQFVQRRDLSHAANQLIKGEGSLFAPDFNRSQMHLKISVLEMMGIHNLLENRERRGDDPAVVAVGEFCIKYRWDIKDLFGINTHNKDGTPKTHMNISLQVLRLVGLKCALVRRVGKRGAQIPVYSAPVADYEKNGKKAVLDEWLCPIPIEDLRGEVFEAWYADDINKTYGEVPPYFTVADNGNSNTISTTEVVTTPVEDEKPEVQKAVKDLKKALSLSKEMVVAVWNEVTEGLKEKVKSNLSALELKQLGEAF